MKMRKLLCLVLSLVLVLSLAACGGSSGKKDKSSKAAKTPEAIAEKYMEAALDADFEKMLDLVHKDVINNGMEAEDMDDDDMQEMIDESSEELEELLAELEEEDIKLSYEIVDVDALDKEMVESGKEYYEDEYDVEITDAKSVMIEISIKADGETEYENIEIYVVKIGGSWYLDIDSVDNFSYLFW